MRTRLPVFAGAQALALTLCALPTSARAQAGQMVGGVITLFLIALFGGLPWLLGLLVGFIGRRRRERRTGMRSAGVRIVNAALLLVPVLLALLDGVAARGEDLGVWGALFAAACFALAMRELWSSPPPPEHHASPEQREAVRRAVEAAFKPDGD